MSGSASFANLLERRPDESTESEMDAMLTDLRESAPRWVAASLDERIELLERVMADTRAVAEAWTQEAMTAKGLTPEMGLEWEEMFGGPVAVVRNARLLRDTLLSIRDDGRPIPPGPITQRPDGQTVVGVFPSHPTDRVLYQGITAEIWMQPGVNPGNLNASIARAYRRGVTVDPTVSLVLGAGNVASIGPMDVLYQLIAEQQVCLLKTNPVNRYLGPHWEAALAGFIEAGYLRVAYGGADVGQYLTAHDEVDTIHMTGSDKTFDAIVFGTGEEGAARKAADDPIFTKPISAELGNVTPIIVVPGPWSDDDITYQANHIAGSLVNNGGFNCIASRVIITHAQWNQREQLIEAIREALANHPERHPYYPGAEVRWQEFIDEHPDAHVIGDAGEGCVPWTFIEGIDPGDTENIAFTVEAFNGVFAETALDVDLDVGVFLEAAVEFANETLWGTLGASIIAHPKTAKDPVIGQALEQAVADLRYGSVGVNCWTALNYALGNPSWGAFPGHPRNDIQSGLKVVHNTYLFDHPQKSVVRAPFRAWPAPFWHVGGAGDALVRKLVDFEADPKSWKIPGILSAALRG